MRPKRRSLQEINPELAAQWHPVKNNGLSPEDVTPNSGKKVWWYCSVGHEWCASVDHRARGRGCPYCAGKSVSIDNCLFTKEPGMALEWHPTKNIDLTPYDVTPGSNRRVWWLCKQGHEWEAQICQRTEMCPYCSGQRVSPEHCLEFINPLLASDWHPIKNGNLTPKEVPPNGSKKVWWLCKRGHEWEATINDRSSGRGCPLCHSSTSELELLLYAELKHIFTVVQHRKKIHGYECDVFIPALKLGLEVDTLYWHKDKHMYDAQKNQQLNTNGISLMNLRENGLNKISDRDIQFGYKEAPLKVVQKVVRHILNLYDCDPKLKKTIKEYLLRNTLANESEYKTLLDRLPSPVPELSLRALDADLSKEWHPTKNGNLTPDDITYNCGKKIWWLCKNGHEWRASPHGRHHRNTKGGCPYCAGRKPSTEHCLLSKNPNLAKEWHPTLNIGLTPSDVTPNSSTKVWWRCSRGHVWQSTISNRSHGRGCPDCGKKRVSAAHCLQNSNPNLARQWHPEKNGSLTPFDVPPSGSKKIWWRCNKGHEWLATINSRDRGNGCPYCAGLYAAPDNCLQSVNPALADEWHFAKNGNLTPRNVLPNSGKSVWWICSNGHEWRERIADRTKDSRCHQCTREHKSLRMINPLLAAEWHPFKNKLLSPLNVTYGSGKKVWWQCKKGHEWTASVASRSAGSGCPHCNRLRRNNRQ